MNDEIEEFFKRLAARKAGDEAAARDDDEEEIIDAEMVDDWQTAPSDLQSGESVADHVQHHMEGSVFSNRDSGLGGAVSQADDRMDHHLSEVFEHKLGQLGGTTGRAEESTFDDRTEKPRSTTPAVSPAEVGRMLRSPQSLRNAIILSELINRPEHRW